MCVSGDAMENQRKGRTLPDAKIEGNQPIKFTCKDSMNDRILPPDGAAATADEALLREVAQLVVSSLNLETAPADIAPDEPLYGEGLGLDSIDILEVALVVSKRYGLQLRADHEDNTRIFSSLRSLADHIASQRTL